MQRRSAFMVLGLISFLLIGITTIASAKVTSSVKHSSGVSGRTGVSAGKGNASQSGQLFRSSTTVPQILPSEGFDLEADYSRDRLYVSLPTANIVLALSMDTLEMVEEFRFDGKGPRGLDLSRDESRLFVALNHAGAVAIIDLTTRTVNEVVVGEALGDSRTWDVVEAKPNRLFVSANPGSSGFAWLALVKLDQGNETMRIEPSRIIRARPTFLASPSADYLYVGEGFSPNSLYKLDISTDSPTIVLEDEHGSVSGTEAMDVSPDGTRIYLRSGQVLRSDSFIQAALVSGGGIPRVSVDGERLYFGRGTRVFIFDRVSLASVDQFPTSCGSSVLDMEPWAGDDGVFVLTSDTSGVYRVCKAPFVHQPTPTPSHTPSATATSTATSSPVVVDIAANPSQRSLRGFAGSISTADGQTAGGNIRFDTPIEGSYILSITEVGSACGVVVKEKRTDGFEFGCNSPNSHASGGSIDWLVILE